MFKKQFLFLFLISALFVNAQNNQLWQGYFSYNQVKDISESATAFYAATENAIFSKNKNTHVLSTVNSVDGLKAETISSLYYSETTQNTFIGNSNGLLLVKNPAGDFLNVNFSKMLTGSFKIKIIDMKGECISTETYQTLPASAALKINVSKLSNGIYFMQILNDEILFSINRFAKLQ